MINNVFNHVEYYILCLIFSISLIKNNHVLSQVLFVIIALLLYFHRNPNPNLPKPLKPNIFYSPTQGKILSVKRLRDKICISIFLSVFDNHTQYVPIHSKKIEEHFNYGFFKFANSPNSDYNQRLTHIFECKYGMYEIVQYTGFFTRRIYSYTQINNKYSVGDRLGYIRFGSRVDICVPNTASTNIFVKADDLVVPMLPLLEF
jgi:phosphatidylserine decarboxylase